MSAHNDGGPAFPQMDAYVNAAGENPVYVAQGGMSLRDWFAGRVEGLPVNTAAAYAEALVGRPCPTISADPLEAIKFWAEAEAKHRYIYADAMLAERAEAGRS